MKLFFFLLIGLTAQFGTIHSNAIGQIEIQETVSKGFEEHLLPDDHPVKLILDNIFTSSRVLSSSVTFKKAGFDNAKERRKGIIVARHPQLPGFLLKLYLETSETDVMEQCLKRINGARLIKNALDKHHYHHIMKVPKKWIYAVPECNLQPRGKYPKKHLLVVEDMDIFNDEENRHLYKTIITTVHLDALFTVLTTCLLSDSTWLPNIPFAHDRKIAFIDTEFAGNSQTIWSRLGRMSKNLSVEMRSYWAALVLNNPRPKGVELFKELAIEAFLEENDSEFEDIDVPSYEFDKKTENSESESIQVEVA